MVRDKKETFDFFDKLKYLFSKPTYFFSRIQAEPAWKALLFYAIIAIIISAIQYLFLYIFHSTQTPLANANMYLRSFQSPWMMFSGGLFGGYFGYWGFASLFAPLIFTIIISFFYAGFTHIFVRSFGGKGSIKDTYKVLLYSLVPSVIIGLIPLVGILSHIYAIIIMIIGVSVLHQLSRGKAVAAVLLPVLMVVLLFIGLILFFILSYTGVFRSM